MSYRPAARTRANLSNPERISLQKQQWGEGLAPAGIENDDEHETSELVRQHFLRFFSRVYSQFRGDVLGGRLA